VGTNTCSNGKKLVARRLNILHLFQNNITTSGSGERKIKEGMALNVRGNENNSS